MDASRQAERQLGARFDLRAFRDALLAQVALPLDIPDGMMRQRINDRDK